MDNSAIDNELRFKIIELILSTGSSVDRDKPFVKAEEIYNWINKNNTQDTAPAPAKKRTTTRKKSV